MATKKDNKKSFRIYNPVTDTYYIVKKVKTKRGYLGKIVGMEPAEKPKK